MNSRAKGFLYFVLPLFVAATFPLLGGEGLEWNEVLTPGTPSYRILFELRLPRLLLTLMAGGALSMLGGSYQILFHNPLAEPYLLGISSAVALGAAVAELGFQAGPLSFTSISAGFFTALIVTGMLAALSASRQGAAMDRLVLFGMGVNFVLSSALFLTLSYFSQHIGGGSLRWLFGQVPWLTLTQAAAFSSACVPFLALILIGARWLDAMSLGDEIASTLGIRPHRVRTLGLVFTSAFLALVVSFTGSIGFVGLVIPHVVRLTFRPASARALLALSFSLGAAFLSMADLISRSLLPPFEFPIGILTTLIGGPIFLGLLWKR